MRIHTTGRRLEVTDPIRAYAESKAEKLLKFFDGVQEIKVVLDQERRDHHEEFTAEVIVELVGHDSIVAKAEGVDVYGSVDLAVDKAGRQLKDFKTRLRDHHDRSRGG